MRKKHLGTFSLFTGFTLPILLLLSPKWLTLQGVGPCWSVLWLLPWVLDKGKTFGAIAGFCLGLLLDSMSIGSATQIPALMILGLWWGEDCGQNQEIDLSLNLGLLAFIGTMIFGFSVWIQIAFLEHFDWSAWFHGWALHTLLAQSILTGLLAPIICSWILLARRDAK